VKLRYFHPTGFQEGGATTSTLLILPPVVKSDPNALRAVSTNALRADKEKGADARKARARTRARSFERERKKAEEEKQLEYEEAIKRIKEVCGKEMADAVREETILKTPKEVKEYAVLSDADMLKTKGLIGSGWKVATAKRYKQIRSFSPKVPYPREEEEMYRVLDSLGIECDPDYDGKFFHQMQRSNWTVRGQRVVNWPELYRKRLEKTKPQDFGPCGAAEKRKEKGSLHKFGKPNYKKLAAEGKLI
jgi:hypothetical protein